MKERTSGKEFVAVVVVVSTVAVLLAPHIERESRQSREPSRRTGSVSRSKRREPTNERPKQRDDAGN